MFGDVVDTIIKPIISVIIAYFRRVLFLKIRMINYTRQILYTLFVLVKFRFK